MAVVFVTRLAGGRINDHAADRIAHQLCLYRRGGRIHVTTPESVSTFYGPSTCWKVKLWFSFSAFRSLLTFQLVEPLSKILPDQQGDGAMNIGDVASQTGLPAKTIRYYEDIGLIRPKRDRNGYRAFNAAELHKLAFLARSRSLGFTIEDCRALLALYEDRGRASADVRLVAHEHLARIDRKLAELEAMRSTLSHLVERCHGDDRPDCPILDDLAQPDSVPS